MVRRTFCSWAILAADVGYTYRIPISAAHWPDIRTFLLYRTCAEHGAHVGRNVCFPLGTDVVRRFSISILCGILTSALHSNIWFPSLAAVVCIHSHVPTPKNVRVYASRTWFRGFYTVLTFYSPMYTGM
jgi:hypothetical protein